MPPSVPRWALVALLLLPPLTLAGVLVARSRPPGQAPGPAGRAVPKAYWPNGQTKLTAVGWREGESVLQELCAFAEDGAALGCGVLKDNRPWDGVVVDFADSAPASPLSEIRSFDHGKRHGTWRSFEPGGVVGVELEYEADRLVSRKVRTLDGVLEPAREPAPRLPAGQLPPKSFPPKRP